MPDIPSCDKCDKRHESLRKYSVKYYMDNKQKVHEYGKLYRQRRKEQLLDLLKAQGVIAEDATKVPRQPYTKKYPVKFSKWNFIDDKGVASKSRSNHVRAVLIDCRHKTDTRPIEVQVNREVQETKGRGIFKMAAFESIETTPDQITITIIDRTPEGCQFEYVIN